MEVKDQREMNRYLWSERTSEEMCTVLENEVGLCKELHGVVELDITGDERSRTCEARGLWKINTTQMDNTARQSIQDGNAAGQRSEERGLSAWASLAKQAWRRV